MNDVKRAGPVARARGLGGMIAATADTTERDRRIPKELLDQLHEARLFRMLIRARSAATRSSRASMC